MSDFISADEARKRSDVGYEKAIASEMGRIKYLIDAATENGEYCVTLPIGTRPYCETVEFLRSKGYDCKFRGGSMVISW